MTKRKTCRACGQSVIGAHTCRPARGPKNSELGDAQEVGMRAEARASCALDGETHHDCRCQACGRRTLTSEEAVLIQTALTWAVREEGTVASLEICRALERACARVRKERA